MNEPNEKPKPKTVEQVYELALKLSDKEREKLYLMLAKDDEQYAQYMDPEIERAAIEECERRAQMVREGKMELIDADVVIREARKILDQSSE